MFDYQTIDSNALKALEATTRKAIMKKLHNNRSYAHVPYAQMRSNLASRSNADLITLEYHQSATYLTQEEVIDDIQKDTTMYTPYYKRWSDNAFMFSELIRRKPIISIYINSANDMADIIEKANAEEHDGVQIEEDLRNLVSTQITYANACAELFTEWNLGESNDVISDLKDALWDTTVIHNGQDELPEDERTLDFTELDLAQTRLIDSIRTEKVDPFILQFMLSPTAGSHGISFIAKTCNPILVKILPATISQTDGIPILGHFYSDPDDPNGNIDSMRGQPDKTLQHLESLVQKAIKSSDTDDLRDGILRWSIGLDQQERGKGENTPSSFHHAFGEPEGSKGKGSRNDRNQPPSSGGQRSESQQQQQPQQQQPQVPDDTSYEPDPLFARLARETTAYVQALPTTDMTNDHMTRFSTTTESPHAVSRDFLLQTDQRIVVRNRYGSSMYLVTYTRKSRKPIFSPVS